MSYELPKARFKLVFVFAGTLAAIARNPRRQTSLVTYLAIFAQGVPSIATAAVLYLPSLLLVLSGLSDTVKYNIFSYFSNHFKPTACSIINIVHSRIGINIYIRSYGTPSLPTHSLPKL